MKVFITGATGFVGQEVVRELREAHHSVRMLARRHGSPPGRELQSKYQTELHAGDVTHPETLRAGFNGVDAVVHLVGIISQFGSSTFENVHVLGTQNVLEAAQQAGVRRFIHMSALGTRPDAVSRYHQTKWAAEEAVRRSGLDYTILRPSLIFGPRDHFVNLFATIARFSPVLPVLGNGRARFQPVAVQGVASAFCKSVAEPAAIGQTFDLCGPEALTFDEMLDAILKSLGRKRVKLHVPLGLARIQAAALEWVFPHLLHRAPPLNRDQIVMLQEDNVGNGERANELFGLAQIRFAEGIANYFKRVISP